MNHTWLFSRRFSLAEVGALCLLVAAVASMTSLLPQTPEASAEIGTAQQLGEKGATLWRQLQQRYGTRNSRNAEEWDYWLRCKDRHYRWEAFKLAQAYMFGKPVQSVASEELAPPIKIDVSAIPSYREPAD